MRAHGFSTIMASLDPPLVVVTTGANDERAGCLVGFHAQSSIDPERYCIWLSKANHTYRAGLQSVYFGIHFLTGDDLALAELFGTQTGDETDKFVGLRVGSGPGGVPLLTDCPHRFVSRRTALLDEGGDHVLIATEPISGVSSGSFAPLRLSQAAHLAPGHEKNEERDRANE